MEFIGGGSSASSIIDGSENSCSNKNIPKSTYIIHDSKRVDIVFNEYDDRYFVIITQLNKIGTLVEASAEDSIMREGALSYNISTLIGKRDDVLIDIYARQVLDLLHK
jgi:hypothetical protein